MKFGIHTQLAVQRQTIKYWHRCTEGVYVLLLIVQGSIVTSFHAHTRAFNILQPFTSGRCFNICSKCSVWAQEIKEYQRPKPILHVWTVNTYDQRRLLIFKDLVWDNVRSIHGICVYIGNVWNPHNCSGPVCRVKLELGATQNTSLMYTVPMLDLLRNYLSHCSTNICLPQLPGTCKTPTVCIITYFSCSQSCGPQLSISLVVSPSTIEYRCTCHNSKLRYFFL